LKRNCNWWHHTVQLKLLHVGNTLVKTRYRDHGHQPSGMSGIECIKQVKKSCPSTQFMMFTVYENNDQVFEALKAGASGYLLKKTSPVEIIAAIKEMHQGGSPMSSTIARKLVSLFQHEHQQHDKETAVLTPREKEVLEQLAKGMLYKEIGDQLGN
jgi:DNA-binding NarL/FixJ family response regulator